MMSTGPELEATAETHAASEQGRREPHVLLLPFPVQGHINPFLQLAKRLVLEGIWVTVALAETVHSRVDRAQRRQLLFTAADDGARHRLRVLPIKDGLPPEFDRANSSAEARTFLNESLAQGVLDMVQTLCSEGRPVTCIVGDFFMHWTCSVAERAAVPEFVFWPQSASTLSIYLHVDTISTSLGYDPLDASAWTAASREKHGDLVTCVPGLPTAIRFADLPFDCTPFGDTVFTRIRGMLMDRFSRLGEARSVIANSFDALEPEAFKSLSREFKQATSRSLYNQCWPRFKAIWDVGPLVPGVDVGEGKRNNDSASGGSLWEEEVEECKQWLDAQAMGSVLYVAFGSLRFMSVTQVQEVALGLAGSGHRFLWAIREDAIRETAEGKLASREGRSVSLEEALPQGFLKESRGVCKVVRWAPQVLVLAHPAVGGFFSHCGWNSTLESVCCGVPLLGWPWLVDQATNCWLASNVWKVGITLERDHDNLTCRKKVEKGVRGLMEGPQAASIRARAREIKSLAAKAAQGSHGLLSFIEDIRNLAG